MSLKRATLRSQHTHYLAFPFISLHLHACICVCIRASIPCVYACDYIVSVTRAIEHSMGFLISKRPTIFVFKKEPNKIHTNTLENQMHWRINKKHRPLHRWRLNKWNSVFYWRRVHACVCERRSEMAAHRWKSIDCYLKSASILNQKYIDHNRARHSPREKQKEREAERVRFCQRISEQSGCIQ